MRKLADNVRFGGGGLREARPCGAYETRYPDHAGGGRAIVLAHGDPEAGRDEDHEMLAVATVNVRGVSETLPGDRVVIKDYSENEGMLAALVEAGVVEDTGERAAFGYVSAPIVRILR